MYPRLRAGLNASRPKDVSETDIYIDIPSTPIKPDGGKIRVLLCYPKAWDTPAATSPGASPVIILFHGGGQTVGNPESELPLARLLVQKFGAVVVMPAYRLAPQHVFPSGFNDGFEVLKMVAEDILVLSSVRPQSTTRVLPAQVRVTHDLIIGGTSAGATIAMSISHLYHRWRTGSSTTSTTTTTTPIPAPPPTANSTDPDNTTATYPAQTGLLLVCVTCIDRENVPRAYQPFYLSRRLNTAYPPFDEAMYELLWDASKTDQSSPLWSAFDQRGRPSDPRAPRRDRVGEDHAWMAGTSTSTDTGIGIESPPMRVALQACGQDLSRDDTLIYERVLREECGVETRLDLYTGFGHVFWGMGGRYPDLAMSRQRTEVDSVEAVRWLLRREGEQEQEQGDGGK